jgi:hypothetical protein
VAIPRGIEFGGDSGIVRLSILEYEEVRADGTCFFCVPGHQITAGGIGKVRTETPTYFVVEKTGVAGALAEEADPRAEQNTEQAG